MTLANVDQNYNLFWLQFTSALPNEISIYPHGNPFAVRQAKKDVFDVTFEADFNRLRYKSSSSQRIAIKIGSRSQCRFTDDASAQIMSSKVIVNYFQVRESKRQTHLTLLESIHYDYVEDPSSLKNHPIVHCQICNDFVGETFFGRGCEHSPTREKTHQHLRIPTANMDVVSVLLCIAADHLSEAEFKKVLTTYDSEGWNRYPHTPQRKTSRDHNFTSRAWYFDQL